jgi:hypothetical protein
LNIILEEIFYYSLNFENNIKPEGDYALYYTCLHKFLLIPEIMFSSRKDNYLVLFNSDKCILGLEGYFVGYKGVYFKKHTLEEIKNMNTPYIFYEKETFDNVGMFTYRGGWVL